MTAETRARILGAALDSFCEHGYGVCVDDIARRAGVVKQTLYHHYGSKDSLFREALSSLIEELLVELEGRSGSVRQDLLRFAEIFEAKAYGEQGLALFRMMVAEAPRFPELVQAVHEAWLKAGQELARLLREAMDRGELREDDTEFASAMLLSMLTGVLREHVLLGLVDRVPPGHTQRVVDTFLRAYEPPRASGRIQKVEGKKA